MSNIKVWVDYWQTTLNALGFMVIQVKYYEYEVLPVFRFDVMELVTGRIESITVGKEAITTQRMPILYLIGEIYAQFIFERMR